MQQTILARALTPMLLIGAVAVAGCGDDDPVSPTTGGIEVNVTATGDPAATEYTIIINDEEIGTTVSGGSISATNLDPGTYTVELTGMTAGCVVNEENPQDVTITAGETEELDFTISCGQTGTVTVAAVTTGDNLDADGYEFVIDGGTPQAIGSNATLDVTDLEPGTSEVELVGIAPNCFVTGENPQSVDVMAGETSTATFDVSCAIATGNAVLTTTTTGTNLPTAAYTLSVDGGAAQDVAVNGTTTVWDLDAGTRSFALTVPANCTITEGATRDVNVVDQTTSNVTYTVTCT